LDRAIGFHTVDPVRNPYAPGAGQRPPELAGRDRELGQFEVVLERITPGPPGPRMGRTRRRGGGKTGLPDPFRATALHTALGNREDRGQAGAINPPAGRCRAAYGGAGTGATAPRPGPDRPFPRRAEGLRLARPQGAEGLVHPAPRHRRAARARPRRLRRL